MLDQQTIDELKAKHGSELELHELGELGDVVIKPPTEAEWRRWSERVSDDKDDRVAATHDLVRGCVVHPDGKAYAEMVRKKPAIVQGLSLRVQRLAGANLIGEGKKL